MTKETFVKLIENAQKYSEELDRWYDFGIELNELPICDLSWNFFYIILPELFTEEGIDWINWWLFERIDFTGKVNKAFDKDGNLIPTDTPDDLWEVVKEYQK